MSSTRAILSYTAAVAALASGFGLWKALAPQEERKKEILKELPEANPVRMNESRNRNVLLMQILKEAAETNENIARSYGSKK